MQPQITANFLAILVCVIAAMPLGFLWFGPLFGKKWAKEMGIPFEEKPDGKTMAKSMAIYLFGSLLTIWVLAHTIPVWMPSTWGVGEDAALWVYAINGAFWNWLGFFLPLQMGRVAWEGRSWRLVLINSSFDFTRLMAFSFILTYWK